MSRQNLRLVTAGLLVSLLLAGFVSFYASGSPDGLERVAGDHGFLAKATPHDTEDRPLAGYAVRGVDDARLSGGLAGAAGVVITLVLAGGLFLLLGRRRTNQQQTSPSADEPSDQAPMRL